ncbi:putative S-adenosyl-L-methionine-dependent methyltransferase [Helianthus annuus]|nr:putative S-adenosyl-L-methionine-dependent methyltransferase [Helianthus annuus]
MAQGKYSRVDGKRSSCSVATVLLVIGVCLIGVWMFMSSPVFLGQTVNGSGQESKSESKTKVSTVSSSQFEDDSGDLSESSRTGGGNDEEPVSRIEESNTREVETSIGDDDDSSESEKSKSEDETGSSSDTNEKEEKKIEDGKKPESFPDADRAEILKETRTESGAFSTQAAESVSDKELKRSGNGYKWKTCNASTGPDFIPCLDNIAALRKIHSTIHYEHRERHCPAEPPTCLVPLRQGYKIPVRWPRSREQIWYSNIPSTTLAEVKGHQNWVKVTGEYLSFPGGGTQFKNGALHYIDQIQKSLPDIKWGKRTRVILDVGCGVASFGGYLFERDVIAMSFAPKDEHEAQVQFALERGIPAISAVMGTQRLPFPSKVFDAIHCARCRVPWHVEGGKLLLELNRVLRPGGYFVWSATPVYQKLAEDVEIWEAMSKLTKAMCWELVTIYKDQLNEVGAAIYKKPTSNECYENRQQNFPPICESNDDPDAIWNVELEACMHKVPVDSSVRGSNWPKKWPERLDSPPYWLKSTDNGVYGKPAPDDFTADYEHWKRVVSKSYINGLGLDWSSIRNVMDMRSIYGGFAAALRDLKVWVMNVVPLDSPDTLPIIYERGLFGIYHDWCESFSTYPRTYDLLHADHLFSGLKKRCKLASVIAEVDRILRPEGKLIVRDNVETIAEIENMAKSLHWNIRMTYNKEQEGLLCVEKTLWRPTEVETLGYTF